MRVCSYARMYSLFADVSKIVQDAPRTGTQAPEPEHRAQATTTKTRAPRNTSTIAAAQQAHEHARIKRNYKNNSK